MILALNWVDLIIIGVLIIFVLESLGRSVILEFLDFITFLLSFFLSFSIYNILAKQYEINFQIPHGLSLVLGFMSVYFLSEIIFYLIISVIFPKIPKFKIRGEKFLPVIPAILRGLVFISFTLVMVATFPIQPTIKKAVLDSKLGSVILKNAYALEEPIKSVFGGVANDSLTFLTVKPKTDEKINLGFRTTNFKVDESSEQTMLALVNSERVSRGLNALVLDERLRSIARLYSKDMFTRGYFSHYSPEGFSVADRMTQAGIDFIVVGENLAYAPSIQSAHKGLMNSPGHRANILSPDYNKIGIGIMDGGVYEEMFTQVFTN